MYRLLNQLAYFMSYNKVLMINNGKDIGKININAVLGLSKGFGPNIIRGEFNQECESIHKIRINKVTEVSNSS